MMTVDKVTNVVVFFKTADGGKGKLILKNVFPNASITLDNLCPKVEFNCEAEEAKFIKIK